MKRMAAGLACLSLGLIPVEAALDPGAILGTAPLSAPPLLLLAPQGDGSLSTTLPFSVEAGEVVVLKSGIGGTSTANWQEVLSFTDVSGHGLATVFVLPTFSNFILQSSGSVEYMSQSSGNLVTSYTPGAGPSTQAQQIISLLSINSNHTMVDSANNEGPNGSSVYNLCVPSPAGSVSAVPEPSTWVAGLSLLALSSLGGVRSLQKAMVSRFGRRKTVLH